MKRWNYNKNGSDTKVIGNYFRKRIENCPGSAGELLSASLVEAVCQDSSVFRIL